jgi:hypothetical protein
MQFTYVICILFSTVFWLLSATDNCRAGSVKGRVNDEGASPPKDGLAGASVRLVPAVGKESDPVPTDADGNYEIRDVANGAYMVVVEKTGYIPRPHQVKITVNGDAMAEPVTLMQGAANNAYYAVVAVAMVKRVSKGPELFSKKRMEAEWERIRLINLPPASRVLLGSEWNKKDSRVGELSDLQPYLRAKADDVEKAQSLFIDAVAGKKGVPDMKMLDEFNLTDEIVADLVIYSVRTGIGSDENRQAFQEQFALKWKDTKAHERVLLAGKKGLLVPDVAHKP